MVYLRVGGRATICEDFNKNGRNWKDVSGHILMITRNRVTLSTEFGQINVPRNKVVPS